MPLTIITGARGAGKTALLRARVAACAAVGRTVGGIASLAVFVGGVRTGYDLVNLRTGEQRLLARVVAPGEKPTIGPYRFDESAIEAGNAAITAAVAARLDVLAIDEVGPLELGGAGWTPGLERALAACPAEQELIVVARTGLVAALAARFPSPLWAAATQRTASGNSTG